MIPRPSSEIYRCFIDYQKTLNNIEDEEQQKKNRIKLHYNDLSQVYITRFIASKERLDVGNINSFLFSYFTLVNRSSRMTKTIRNKVKAIFYSRRASQWQCELPLYKVH